MITKTIFETSDGRRFDEAKEAKNWETQIIIAAGKLVETRELFERRGWSAYDSFEKLITELARPASRITIR